MCFPLYSTAVYPCHVSPPLTINSAALLCTHPMLVCTVNLTYSQYVVSILPNIRQLLLGWGYFTYVRKV